MTKNEINMINNENFLNKFKVFKSLKKYNHSPKTFDEFLKILNKKSKLKDGNLNDVDVSNLVILNGFNRFDFFVENNFFVDELVVSNVKYFNFCFYNCKKFNCDLNKWDVSNGIVFNGFLYYCYGFNKEFSKFILKNAESVESFFSFCFSFNSSVNGIKFGNKVKKLNYFFNNCLEFNQDVSMLDVSNVEDFSNMFQNCKNFKQDLRNWNVSNAKKWKNIFKGSLMEKYSELMPERFKN